MPSFWQSFKKETFVGIRSRSFQAYLAIIFEHNRYPTCMCARNRQYNTVASCGVSWRPYNEQFLPGFLSASVTHTCFQRSNRIGFLVFPTREAESSQHCVHLEKPNGKANENSHQGVVALSHSSFQRTRGFLGLVPSCPPWPRGNSVVWRCVFPQHWLHKETDSQLPSRLLTTTLAAYLTCMQP